MSRQQECAANEDGWQKGISPKWIVGCRRSAGHVSNRYMTVIFADGELSNLNWITSDVSPWTRRFFFFAGGSPPHTF